MTARRPADGARSYRTCDAPGCEERVPRGMLMCKPHWFLLPKPLREAINATWRSRRTTGLRIWSANVLEARRFLANHNPAAIAARIVGDQL